MSPSLAPAADGRFGGKASRAPLAGLSTRFAPRAAIRAIGIRASSSSPRGASFSARTELSDQMVDDARHGHGDTEVEFVDGDEGTNSSRRRESRVGEYALQASGLLQYQRQVAVWRHDDPAKTD